MTFQLFSRTLRKADGNHFNSILINLLVIDECHNWI